MTKLTEQEAFNIAYRTLRDRGFTRAVRQSLEGSDGFVCQYRSPLGPCAIGALIPDEEYHEVFDAENMFASQVQDFVPTLQSLGGNFLNNLQMCHDEGRTPDDMRERLERFARERNLTVPAQAPQMQAAEFARETGSFQQRVHPWMIACFGPEIASDRLERSDRFIEEALELVQASNYPKERALALVDYVYGRDQGDINQEVGGVMVTLAAHCLAHGVDMHEAAETELARIWTKVEQIRAKQAAKPTGSALPIAQPDQSAT